MGTSYFLTVTLFCAVIAVVLGLVTRSCFRNYKVLDNLLKGAGQMTAATTATISELVELRRRNRRFRWVNEYPVLSYEADGRQFNLQLPWAEARRGTYAKGQTYTLNYLPSDPEQSIVPDFTPKMKKVRTSYKIATGLAGFFTFNLACSSVINLLASFGL